MKRKIRETKVGKTIVLFIPSRNSHGKTSSPEFNTEHEIMCDMEAEINACNRQHFLVLFCSSTDLDLQLLSMNHLLS